MARGKRKEQTTKAPADPAVAAAEEVPTLVSAESSAAPTKDSGKSITKKKNKQQKQKKTASLAESIGLNDDTDLMQLFKDQLGSNEDWGDCLVQALGAEDRVQSVQKLTQLGKGVGVFSKDGKSLFWSWAEQPQQSLSEDDVRSRGLIGEYSTASGALIRILGQQQHEKQQQKASKNFPNTSFLRYPAVLTVTLNPSNPLQLVSVSRDGVIRIWDTTDGSLLREMATLKTIRALIPHPTRNLSYFIVSHKVNLKKKKKRRPAGQQEKASIKEDEVDDDDDNEEEVVVDEEEDDDDEEVEAGDDEEDEAEAEEDTDDDLEDEEAEEEEDDDDDDDEVVTEGEAKGKRRPTPFKKQRWAGKSHKKRRRPARFGFGMLTFDSQPQSNGNTRYKLNKLGESAFAPSDVAVNPDGTLLAATIGKQVWLWNLANDTFHRFRHEQIITCIAFHPFEPYFTVGDAIGTLTSFYYQKRRSTNGSSPSSLPSSSSSSSSSGLKSSLWGRKGADQRNNTTNTNNKSTPSKSEETITTECVTSRLKWHAHEVLSLCFTEDGAYLLSGGHEGVLVLWQLRTGSHNFLPRFGDMISRIVAGPSASTYALALLQSNTVVLVDAATLKIRSHVQGFQRPTKAGGKPSIGLIAAPLPSQSMHHHQQHQQHQQQQQVLTNGISGSVQWFNVEKGTSDRLLEVAYNTIAVRNKNYRLSPCEVTHAAVSHDGSWLVTADHRFDRLSKDRSLSETTLRFWQYSAQKGTYELNTSVLNPHKNGRKLVALRFHPHDDLVVTLAAGDTAFRFWTPVVQARRTHSKVAAKHTRRQKKTLLSWVCRSIGQYQEHARVNDCAFSLDGSLLAVACGSVVSLWDPYLNVLLRTLVHSPSCDYSGSTGRGSGRGQSEKVMATRFIQSDPNGASPHPHLAVFTASRLVMWDLLTCQVAWEAAFAFNQIAVSPDGCQMAVTTCLVEEKFGGMDIGTYHWQNPWKYDTTRRVSARKRVTTFICLFETGQPVPLKTWRLQTAVHGLVFLGNKTITALSAKNEFLSFSLDDSEGEPRRAVTALVDAGAQAADEQVNNLAIFVDAATTGAAKASAAASSLTPVSSIHLDAASKILDTPSHLLPALSSLYSTFMSAILRPASAASSKSASELLVDDAPSVSSASSLADSGERVADDSFREFQTLKATLADTYESAHYAPFAEVFTDLFQAKESAEQPTKPTQTPSKSESQAAQAKPTSKATPGKSTSDDAAPTKPAAQSTPSKTSSAQSKGKATPAKATTNQSTPAKLKSQTTPAKSSSSK